MKTQETFCRILLAKKIELKEKNETLKGVSISTIGRWHAEKQSPHLKDVERICLENDIELPFFFDGNVESLFEYNKRIGEKMGFKIQLIFES